MVGVSGEGEAGERGGGEVHLSGRHHAATHAWLKFVASRKSDKIEKGLTSFLAMEGQMIGAGKTVTQPVASEKPKTHSGGTVFGYSASACLMLKEYYPLMVY